MSKPIENIIYFIRGKRVMFDRDLAKLYSVSTTRLNEQVQRNIKRFPENFMFQLTKDELSDWISQFAISNSSIKIGLRKCPYVFTEYGAIMLSSVLRTEQAISMSIKVVEAFIQMRKTLTVKKKFAKELQEIKSFMLKHSHKTDREFRKVWEAIEKLTPPPSSGQRAIGFRLD